MFVFMMSDGAEKKGPRDSGKGEPEGSRELREDVC